MRLEEEIKKIVQGLSEKSSFSDLNREKLINYFFSTELNCNDENFPYLYHLSEIKRKQRDGISLKSPDHGFSWKLSYLIAPALTALVVFAALFTLNTFRTDKTGDSEGKFFAAAKDFTGNVHFERGRESGTINNDSKLVEGDSLITGKESYSDIFLGRNVSFRLGEKSRLFLREISSSGGMKNFSFDLVAGELLLNIKKLRKGDSITIYTPSLIATVKGTLFGMRVDPNRDSLIEVYEGKVKVRNNLPPGSEKLDSQSKRELEKLLEDKAVIVNRGDSCNVKQINKDIDPILPESFKRKLSLIPSPTVRENKPEKFKTSISMFSFIKNHEGDTKLKEIRNHLIKLPVKKEKLVSKKTGSSIITSWKKNNRALYLIYASVPGLFISASKNGRIEATDLKQIKWALMLPGKIESRPAVDGNKLFFSTTENRLGAVNLMNGQLLWSEKVKGHLQKNVRIVTDRNSLYAATSKGMLYRYTKNGKEIWALGFEDVLETTPVLGMHMVLVSVNGGRLYGIDRNMGIKIIKKKFESKIVSMVIHKSNIFVISDMGNLICYNYLDDEFLWSRNLKSDILSEMLIEGKNIYIFTTKGTIYKIDDTGKSIWKSSIGNRIARNAIADKKFIYLAVDNAFYVVNKETGEVKWSVVTPPVISGSIAASGEKVIFVTDKKGLTELKK